MREARGTVAVVLVLTWAVPGAISGTNAIAGEPPNKMPPDKSAAGLRSVLLFPSPSELATRLRATGFQIVQVPKLSEQIPKPDWTKLTPTQRELQLGSVLGYLAYAAALADMKTLAGCFDQVLAGAGSLGVDKKSKAYVGMTQIREKIRRGQISDEQVLAGLDELRRHILQELAGRSETKELTFVLAAAWLRGSSLLARQVKTDAEAGRLAGFIMRPELISFVGKIPDTNTGTISTERRTATDRMLALAKDSQIRKSDLSDFAGFADAVLK